MKKKIVFILLVILLAAAAFFALKRAPVAEVNQNTEGQVVDDQVSILPEQTLPLLSNPKEIAWNLFQKYLSYNKVRDLEGVKSVVHKVAAVCTDPKQRLDCEARMAAAYEYGSSLNKQDFKNVWTDEKQTILSTDFWVEDSTDLDSIGRFRSIIFFIKDGQGNLKLLSFSPTQGGATSKGVASDEELQDRILRWTEDQDQDGRLDYEEECLGVKEGQTCVKSNPKTRDSDGNGYYDSIDILIGK